MLALVGDEDCLCVCCVGRVVGRKDKLLTDMLNVETILVCHACFKCLEGLGRANRETQTVRAQAGGYNLCDDGDNEEGWDAKTDCDNYEDWCQEPDEGCKKGINEQTRGLATVLEGKTGAMVVVHVDSRCHACCCYCWLLHRQAMQPCKACAVVVQCLWNSSRWYVQTAAQAALRARGRMGRLGLQSACSLVRVAALGLSLSLL
eukprot:2201452-Rhodomonas_salina.2